MVNIQNVLGTQGSQSLEISFYCSHQPSRTCVLKESHRCVWCLHKQETAHKATEDTEENLEDVSEEEWGF